MGTLFPHTFQLETHTGSYVGGRWVAATPSASTFTGSVQPVTGKETQFLPENRRDAGLVKVYSDTALNVSLEGSNTPGDVVIWAGKRWEVFQELVYANDLINHFKYLAAYIGPYVPPTSGNTQEQAQETPQGEQGGA